MIAANSSVGAAPGGALPTSLEAPETSSKFRLPSHYRAFFAGDLEPEVEATAQAYSDFDPDKADRKVEALRNCRSHAHFSRHRETGEVVVFSSKCRLRWCPLCAKALAGFRSQSVKDWLGQFKKPKFLTLTLQHSDNCLPDQIDALYKAFQRFRKQTDIKKRIRGGIWFFQVHRAKSSGQWHPHLHCVLDADYMDQADLSRLWAIASHGSKIVDIRAIHNPKKVAQYVARYSSRPAMLSEHGESDRAELIRALHGRRLCGKWGTGRDCQLSPESEFIPEDWEDLGSWLWVVGLMQADQRAKKIVRAWQTGKSLESGCTVRDVESEHWKRAISRPPDPPPYLPDFFNLDAYACHGVR